MEFNVAVDVVGIDADVLWVAWEGAKEGIIQDTELPGILAATRAVMEVMEAEEIERDNCHRVPFTPREG